MKLGLILAAINPRLGGVLIRGAKGTAKSTAVRALVALLPEIGVAEGCPFNCDPDDHARLCDRCRALVAAGAGLGRTVRRAPMIDLPLSATEDRVVGSLDLEYAIKHGRRRFEPGILAQANRGIIYVDEVNLLDDHLVDILLDAAATGLNVVEREGVSCVHPADFLLVGTMNPEEGGLRPQLTDRFGLCVEVEAVGDPARRVEIIKRREAFDADSTGFIARWEDREQAVGKQIATACRLLPSVTISSELLELIARLCLENCVAGHRADVVMAAAARTMAAWRGRDQATEQDVRQVADLVLLHRKRQASPPFSEQSTPPVPDEPAGTGPEEQEPPPPEPEPESERPEQSPATEQDGSAPEERDDDRKEQEQSDGRNNPAPPAPEVVSVIGQAFPVRKITHNRDRILRQGSGRRSRTKTAVKAGRYVRSTMERTNNDLAFDATLRAAAPHQISRRRDRVAVAIETADIREKVREKRIGNFLLFVVDASGSMGAQQRMVETKGAILSLLLDAYQKRDRIGMIAFKGSSAEVLLPPTSSVELAHKLLEELPTGGKTPLAAGLSKAYEVAGAQLLKDPRLSPILIVITDGKGNVSIGPDKPMEETLQAAELIGKEERIKSLVIDVERQGLLTFGLARKLAGCLGAEYCKIDDLKADALVQAISRAVSEG
jgi:magnesium chelatase subunit D